MYMLYMIENKDIAIFCGYDVIVGHYDIVPCACTPQKFTRFSGPFFCNFKTVVYYPFIKEMFQHKNYKGAYNIRRT